MKSQDYIHKFMDEVFSFFKNYDSAEPITLFDLQEISVEGEGYPDDNINEWIDDCGETPLHYAVRFHEALSLENLLFDQDKRGNRFNVFHRNALGKTAMRMALERGDLACVSVLSYRYPSWFQRKLRNAIKSFARRTATI